MVSRLRRTGHRKVIFVATRAEQTPRRFRQSGPRLLLAVLGGVLLYLANPPRELWWLAPVGIAMLCLSLHGRKARAGFGYGLVFGLAWMLPLFKWLWDFLGPGYGPWPWLGVTVVCALLFAVPCTIMALASTLPLAPVYLAATFVAGEAIRSRFPIGGFPWAQLAFSQPSGPLLPFAAIGSAPLLTFVVGFTGAALAQVVLLVRRRVWQRNPRALIVPVVLTLAPVIIGLAITPLINRPEHGPSVRAMAIQGNGPDIGLDLLNAGDVLWQRNLTETEHVAQQIRTGEIPKPDLVIVPESVADLPGTRPQDLGRVKELADLLHTPVAVGARSLPPDAAARNVVVGYDPKTGKTGEYTKQHLAPYGEFVPLRAIARWFTPFVGEGSDMQAGTQPGVIPLGKAKVGMAICFDAAYDDVLRGATNSGATLLAVPTNNAWFGRTEMTYQQQAMSRVRAVEHDRAVVIAATTGSSAVIRPDGSVQQRTGQFQATEVSAEVPLRSKITVADTLGAWPEWILTFLGLVGLGHSVVMRRRVRSTGSTAR
jgi:apolipoprotein N-acyltransferase